MEEKKRERTLIYSIVFSSFGPVVTFIALLMNTSVTQFADFTRRTSELVVLVLALFVFRLLHSDTIRPARKKTLRKMIYTAVGIALIMAAALLVFMGLRSIANPQIPSGNVWLGVSVAALGVFFNGYFWIRYTLFNKQETDTVMHTQSRLYQAKTVVDVSVLIALSSVVVFSGEWISYWIDLTTTFLISIYLTFRSVRMLIYSTQQ